MEDDLFIEDILEIEKTKKTKKTKKKKINGKAKGDRVELQLCKLLTKHFGKEFSRSVGSGNRWSQVKSMPAHAKKTLIGDICVLENFKFVIECKGGYDDDVDFSSILDGGCSRVDEFIEQSIHDAEQSGRLPLICWKRSRKPWVAMVRKKDLPSLDEVNFYFIYKNWIALSLNCLLEIQDRKFWFNE